MPAEITERKLRGRTLDVSTIILHGNREQDVVSFHVCEVEPFGALRLFAKRAEALDRVEPGSVRQTLSELQDGTRRAPETLMEIVTRPTPALSGAFTRVSDAFSIDVLAVAIRCLVRFRQMQHNAHRNPGHDPWGDSLRFFLTGGGARSPFYRSLLAGGPLEQRLATNYTRWHPEQVRRRSARQGLRLESFPVPDRLQNFPQTMHAEFDRLSVAYGLAFGGENLMRITTNVR